MPSDSDLQDFAAMSAALTGFTLDFIRPQLDPVDLTGQYYDMANQKQPQALAALLTAYRAISSQPPQQIADNLLGIGAGSNQQTMPMAQSVVKMWYSGSWYEPGSTEMEQVVSSMAYTKGLVWQVMQAHAMGYSPFVFGYWNTPPGPLSQFGVNMDRDKGGAQ